MRRKKKCPWCRQEFIPKPNIGTRQKACGKKECLDARKKEADRKWRRQNRMIHLQMIRDWFLAHPGYLKKYRLSHPEYRRRNIEETKDRRKRRYQTLFDKKTSKRAIPCFMEGKSPVLSFDKKTSSPVDSP